MNSFLFNISQISNFSQKLQLWTVRILVALQYFMKLTYVNLLNWGPVEFMPHEQGWSLSSVASRPCDRSVCWPCLPHIVYMEEPCLSDDLFLLGQFVYPPVCVSLSKQTGCAWGHEVGIPLVNFCNFFLFIKAELYCMCIYNRSIRTRRNLVYLFKTLT